MTTKCVTSLQGPSSAGLRTTQLLSKKCCSGSNPSSTLCPICPSRDLNLGPPDSETNALALNQLAGWPNRWICEFTVLTSLEDIWQQTFCWILWKKNTKKCYQTWCSFSRRNNTVLSPVSFHQHSSLQTFNLIDVSVKLTCMQCKQSNFVWWKKSCWF